MFKYRMLGMTAVAILGVLRILFVELGTPYMLFLGGLAILFFCWPYVQQKIDSRDKHMEEGSRYLELGDLRSAERELMAAEGESHRRAMMTVPAKTAIVLKLAETQRRQRKFPEAEAAVKRAFALLGAAKSSTQYGECLELQAAIARDQGDHSAALKLFRQAIERDEKLPRANQKAIARRYLELGQACVKAGDAVSAAPVLEKAMTLTWNAFGEDSPETARTLATVGGVYFQLERTEEAQQILERGLTAQKKVFGHNAPEVAEVMLTLGDTYQRRGMYEQATGVFEEALHLRETHLSKSDQETASVMCRLASCYLAWGQAAKAGDLVKRAIFFLEASPDQNLAAAADLLGTIYDRQGRFSEAAPLYDYSRSLWEKYLGAGSAEVRMSIEKSAAVLRRLNRGPEADRLIAQFQTATA